MSVFDEDTPKTVTDLQSTPHRQSSARHDIEQQRRLNRIQAEIPRLRRYARILSIDPNRADRLVQDCLQRTAREYQDSPSNVEPRRSLFHLPRSIYLKRGYLAQR